MAKLSEKVSSIVSSNCLDEYHVVNDDRTQRITDHIMAEVRATLRVALEGAWEDFV